MNKKPRSFLRTGARSQAKDNNLKTQFYPAAFSIAWPTLSRLHYGLLAGKLGNTMNKEEKLLRDRLAHNANVQRPEIKGTGPERANATLRQIGKGMEGMVSEPNRKLEYVGSAAVHIYRWGEYFKTLDYACQCATLNEVPEHVASTALDALRKDLQAHYGRDRQVTRSGF